MPKRTREDSSDSRGKTTPMRTPTPQRQTPTPNTAPPPKPTPPSSNQAPPDLLQEIERLKAEVKDKSILAAKRNLTITMMGKTIASLQAQLEDSEQKPRPRGRPKKNGTRVYAPIKLNMLRIPLSDWGQPLIKLVRFLATCVQEKNFDIRNLQELQNIVGCGRDTWRELMDAPDPATLDEKKPRKKPHSNRAR